MPSSPSVVLHDVTFAWPDGTVALDHLTAAFGRELRTTPTRYRADAGGHRKK